MKDRHVPPGEVMPTLLVGGVFRPGWKALRRARLLRPIGGHPASNRPGAELTRVLPAGRGFSRSAWRIGSCGTSSRDGDTSAHKASSVKHRGHRVSGRNAGETCGSGGTSPSPSVRPSPVCALPVCALPVCAARVEPRPPGERGSRRTRLSGNRALLTQDATELRQW